MNSELDQLRERVRQNREALAADAVPADAKGATVADGVKRTLVAGDRVFDRVTGAEGIVQPAALGAASEQQLVAVRLPNGGVLIRSAEQLVLRPTPPRAKP